MTTGDDMHHKLTNVTEQLGRERGENDRLSTENKILKDDLVNLQSDYRAAVQRIRDLQRSIEQMNERSI